jgi:non-heme chloroperoxidase
MPSFTSPDGLTLHYRELGKGDPVVLVHGWMVGGAVWDPVVGALVESGKRLIIPDQRGTGSSDKPPSGYSLEHYAADLRALVDAAQLERFDLIGHSMGGQIAQLGAIALGERVRSMILVCPVPASGIPLPDELVGLFRNSGGDPEAQTAIFNMATKQLDEAGLRALLATAATVSKECIEQSFDAWTAGGFADRLGKIVSKTYVLGTDDPFLPPEFLQQAVVDPIPNAEFVHLRGPGHYPANEAPEATAARLVELLP